jgi:hypothetical protein
LLAIVGSGFLDFFLSSGDVDGRQKNIPSIVDIDRLFVDSLGSFGSCVCLVVWSPGWLSLVLFAIVAMVVFIDFCFS